MFFPCLWPDRRQTFLTGHICRHWTQKWSSDWVLSFNWDKDASHVAFRSRRRRVRLHSPMQRASLPTTTQNTKNRIWNSSWHSRDSKWFLWVTFWPFTLAGWPVPLKGLLTSLHFHCWHCCWEMGTVSLSAPDHRLGPY